MANLTKGHLIIGHTTDRSTTIWVRGEKRQRWARVALENGKDSSPVEPIEWKLNAKGDSTGVAVFTGLRAETLYTVSARFARTRLGLKLGGTVPHAQGRVRTFPAPDSASSFSFLHGSCNLSTVRLMHAGGFAAGTLGALFTLLSLQGGRWPVKVRQFFHRRMYNRALKATRFEQSKLKLSSPFDRLPELVTTEESHQPRFMIHAGDQIYFDFPFSGRPPDPAEYRRTYRQTWFEDPKLRELLTRCPHYMMLDDHDIIDGFAKDRTLPGARPRPHASYLEPAKQAYREYVHLRHPSRKPDGPFFYRFEYGSTPFFVLDTRTERSLREEQMIDREQMEELKHWLVDHKTKLKFVVSSVAFVAELRPDRERQSFKSKDDFPVDPAAEEQIDKWCGRPYRRQREEILEFVFSKGIERLVFLVGDMHCAYHATMRVGYVGHGSTLHELAGGPAYQLRFASRRDFYDQCRGTITSGNRKVPYATSLRRTHGTSSSILRITASPSEVRWKIVDTAGKRESVPEKPGSAQAAAWDGLISF